MIEKRVCDLDQVAAVAKSGWFWMCSEGRAQSRPWDRLHARRGDQVDAPQAVGLSPWRMALHPGALRRGPAAGGQAGAGSGGGRCPASVCAVSLSHHPRRESLLELHVRGSPGINGTQDAE